MLVLKSRARCSFVRRLPIQQCLQRRLQQRLQEQIQQQIQQHQSPLFLQQQLERLQYLQL